MQYREFGINSWKKIVELSRIAFHIKRGTPAKIFDRRAPRFLKNSLKFLSFSVSYFAQIQKIGNAKIYSSRNDFNITIRKNLPLLKFQSWNFSQFLFSFLNHASSRSLASLKRHFRELSLYSISRKFISRAVSLKKAHPPYPGKSTSIHEQQPFFLLPCSVPKVNKWKKHIRI